MGKAALPAWLGLQMGLGSAVATAAGLAAVAGHNWPVFFHFTGGRGLGTFMGLLLVIFPWGFPWMLGFLALGWLLGDSAPWALASLVTLPLFAHLVDGPNVVTLAAGIMLLLTLAKRLEANRRPLPPPGPERRRVLVRRLFLDRDIASHAEWINRRPETDHSDRA
jgi:glycerol-3-phosphate acyltransferase PlsY